MKLTALRHVVTRGFGRQVLVAQKHSPTVLFGLGVVGVVVTAVAASRATLKMDEILTNHEEQIALTEKVANDEKLNSDYSEEDRIRDLTIVYARTGLAIAKAYAPSVLCGVASVVALTGSHVILSRRNVAITAAYAALDKGFREYRERVREEIGADKESSLRHGYKTVEIVEETEQGPVVKTIRRANKASIYARFFDEYSTQWQRDPAYNVLFVNCQQNYANDLLRARGHVFLNEVYDMLGLPRTKEGSVVGWLRDGDGDGYVDFKVFEGDTFSAINFVNGSEPSVLLDFNVDGIIYDKI